jgi:hypothetical protein
LTAQATPPGWPAQYPQEGITHAEPLHQGAVRAGGVVAVSSALGLAGATAASATVHVRPHATTVCDNNPGTVSPRCTNISNLMLNQDNGPTFIQNATQKGVKAPSLYQNRIINLRQASNTRTNEDFIIRQVGVLGQLCGTGGVNSIDPTSYACLNYPLLPGVPGSVRSELQRERLLRWRDQRDRGFKARLERCGTPRTFWVGDLAASIQITLPGINPSCWSTSRSSSRLTRPPATRWS